MPLLLLSPARAADQTLIDAAKTEGELTWYTTLTIDQLARPLAEAFQRKYGVKVNINRTDGAEVAFDCTMKPEPARLWRTSSMAVRIRSR